ncbi:siderophore-interacting protein [Corynebacterium pseudodiphtheriticum]|uniref:siderophore-interacting protein n=1 Tax=Corynebacterium pseudodiphtheriticum TaxID=37637 RepID=UPI002551B63A|nr:siderophore-interacting protein [Corynebacterium pseudodiphtheriticum]MDK8614637.1 siderophore-interacting protein [Corynebacterium pseudodiphtheriticum]MDK8738539.1 siderophore-interacting protein [Corynebacterium pseudodiphtheriticum]MDK8745081.1 siderophore-interacting protein [Corynebacterium pseudodiphtheriticum]
MAANHSTFLDTRLSTPPGDARHDFLRCRVESIEMLAEELVRVHLHSPAFADLRLTGPDEFFGLVMPTSDASLDGLADALATGDRTNLRAVIASCDSAWRPELRWYTFRSLNRENATACFDVATHGKRSRSDSTKDTTEAFPAPGVNWVLRAQAGDECAVYTSRGLWHHPSSQQLLIADPSALPSVWAILDYCQNFHPNTLGAIRVIALAETDADIEVPALHQWEETLAGLDVVKGPYARHQELLTMQIEKLAQQHPEFHPEYLWASGEMGMAKTARKLGMEIFGLDSAAIQWCVYWIAGKARP